jgi:epsilon-lactone hydrolase
MWFQAKGLPRPRAIGVLGAAPPTAPWPYGKVGDSRMWSLDLLPERRRGEVLRKDGDPICWYMEAADEADINAYPGSSDAALATFPPTLLLVGSRETWLSSALHAHARLLRLRVDATLYVMEGGWHEAHVFAVSSREAHDANAYVAHWFEARLAR